ncbi:uncharacterized protein AC631_05636 [Debaryomyces fabryi]|uniref:Uncharacterized protein n=1 Tax=Debaryomyces fabryi TaxID=58627 RepID=A0A0V1PQT2_9ASCO|nr:uncharacterized protein AC631_05636 [Debaryomyces fabryi]KRZ98599.1 hypothetical protein AC631_05636 [Debaryomyces fabryi]
MNEIKYKLNKNSSTEALTSDLERIEPKDAIVERLNEIENINKNLLDASVEGIEKNRFSLATDGIQEVGNTISPQFNENSREKSISEVLYPSLTQELDDLHRDNDSMNESEIIHNKKDLNTESDIYQRLSAEDRSQNIQREKKISDEISVNEAEENYDRNRDDMEGEVADENEERRSFSSNYIIVEEPKEEDENAIIEYEQTTYVNIMGDGILHPSNIMEPEEEECVEVPKYSEQIEIVTGPLGIDDIEVLEPSTIVEPNDTDGGLVELINSAFEQGYENEYEIIEPTDVLEPLSRSQTPFGKHDELTNSKEKLYNRYKEDSRKRSRESEGFISSKLRKLISKPFQWLSKARKSPSKIPAHIKVPKLKPVDDNSNISPQKKNTQKFLRDIALQHGINDNNKKYDELIRHLKKSMGLKRNEIGKDKLHNISDLEREKSSLNDFKIDDEDNPNYDTTNGKFSDITSMAKAEENTIDEEDLQQSKHEGHFEKDRSDSSSTTIHSLHSTNSEIDDSNSPKNLHSINHRSTDKKSKSKLPKKILGLDMSEVHIEPVRSLRSGHKYGLEENDDIQTSDLLSSPKKNLRSSRELPKLHVNKQRHLSNTKVLVKSSPTEVDSKQSLPSSRKSSGSKWIETLLDHPALRTRSKSPLKRSIYQISSDLEEDSNLPRRSRRLRLHDNELNNESDNEKLEMEEVKRGRPKKRH